VRRQTLVAFVYNGGMVVRHHLGDPAGVQFQAFGGLVIFFTLFSRYVRVATLDIQRICCFLISFTVVGTRGGCPAALIATLMILEERLVTAFSPGRCSLLAWPAAWIISFGCAAWRFTFHCPIHSRGAPRGRSRADVHSNSFTGPFSCRTDFNGHRFLEGSQGVEADCF